MKHLSALDMRRHGYYLHLGLVFLIQWSILLCVRSDDESDDGEIDDETLNKLIIVTQTPPSLRKHPGGDRTGDFVPRSKMTAELAKVINDGLYFYEQELLEQENKVSL